MYKRQGITDYWSDKYPQAIIEPTVKMWHVGKIEIGEGTYIGHDAILKGYPYYSAISIRIGKQCWIGDTAYFHGAGGLVIGDRVGIGPGVKILTSSHDIDGAGHILDRPLVFKGVTIEDGADIGAGACILPGVRIGKGAQVGMGSVVTHDVAHNSVVAGNPARLIRQRRFEAQILKEAI